MAITYPQLVDESFYGRLGNAQRFGELLIRNVLAIRCQTITQYIKHTAASAGLAFFAQLSQCVFDYGSSPSHIVNFFRRPDLSFVCRDRQTRRRFSHPLIPGNKFHVAATFARPLPDFVVSQKILCRLEQKRPEPAAVGISAFEK